MNKPKSKRQPKPEGTPVETAKATMRDMLNRVEYSGERVVITRHKKPVAALVSIADYKRLEGAA